ncbi:hypothetical protein ACFL27_10450 [candidate division CSSED10-310 bacterium]|uniref:Uncharacterized protein n=1 Tax=candidate division CSSED10-310 bacterium TaxID=2855610 RepID=A0ABV6YWL7_UNCC1
MLEPIKNREKFLRKSWLKLNQVENVSIIDVVKVQPPLWTLIAVTIFMLGIVYFWVFGFFHVATGAFMGGLTVISGQIMRTKRDWQYYNKYLDWEKIKEGENQNT